MPQVQYIDLSKIAHVREDVIIVISVHFDLSTLFVVNRVWLLNCPLNGG